MAVGSVAGFSGGRVCGKLSKFISIIIGSAYVFH